MNILKGFSNIFQGENSLIRKEAAKESIIREENNLFSVRMKNHRPYSFSNQINPFTQTIHCTQCASELLSHKHRPISDFKDLSERTPRSEPIDSIHDQSKEHTSLDEKPLDNYVNDQQSNSSFSFGDKAEPTSNQEKSFTWSKALNLSDIQLRNYFNRLIAYISHKGDYRNFPQIDFPNYSNVMRILSRQSSLDRNEEEEHLYQKDIIQFYFNNIITDKLLSNYIELLMLRALEEANSDYHQSHPPLLTYFMPCDFYKEINSKPELIHLKYFTRNRFPIRFNQYDQVLIPIKISNSSIWHIVSLSFPSYICSFYSCMLKQNNTADTLELLTAITDLFDSFFQEHHLIPQENSTRWSYHHIQPIPYVSKNISCSLSLVCLDFLSRGLQMSITSNDLYYYTILIIIEVLNGKLYTS